MEKNLLNGMYHLHLANLLLIINIYFYLFVHFINDLTPNFALAIITLPFGLFELMTAFKFLNKRLKKKRKWIKKKQSKR